MKSIFRWTNYLSDIFNMVCIPMQQVFEAGNTTSINVTASLNSNIVIIAENGTDKKILNETVVSVITIIRTVIK